MFKDDLEIKLLFIDYVMLIMDGFELVKVVCNFCGCDDLVIIGLLGVGKYGLLVCFIKYGVNDFLIKLFMNEEFYCCVM